MNIVSKCLATLSIIVAQHVYALDPGGQPPTTQHDSANSIVNCPAAHCPAASFRDFLSSFINEEETRIVNTSITVDVYDLVIQNADQIQPYEKWIASKIDVLSMLKDDLTSEKNHVVSWIKPKSAEALFFDEHSPEIRKRYSFLWKSGCWVLSSVFNELIPPPEMLSEGRQEKANSCLRVAEKYEAIASHSEDSNSYDRALYAYLCAAQNGSAQAAVRAAQLGTSGQSRMLPTSYVERLFLQAADQGISSAMTALAELRCGDLAVCAAPIESYVYLSRAILAGDNEAINTLGVWIERGRIGKPDASRALSCYRLAAERGSKLGVQNFKKLSAGWRNIKPAQCPLNDSSIFR